MKPRRDALPEGTREEAVERAEFMWDSSGELKVEGFEAAGAEEQECGADVGDTQPGRPLDSEIHTIFAGLPPR